MIAKGKSIGHGAAMAEYAMYKERAEFVCSHGLPEYIEPEAMWERMMNHQCQKAKEKSNGRAIEKKAIRFEVSPVNNNTEGWTIDDWKELAEEFLREMDSITHIPNRPNTKFEQTNLMGSMYLASLHHDSDSGIRHLHIMVNRVDDEGNTNDAHFIGLRATMAANAITERRGWVQAKYCREANITQITNDCFDVLLHMPAFSWDDYEASIKEKGYNIKLKRDSKDKVVGYTIRKGHSTYKASELKGGKKLNASKLEDTWNNLHNKKQKTSVSQEPRKNLTNKPQSASISAAPSHEQQEPRKPSSYKFTLVADNKPYMVSVTPSLVAELDKAFEISLLEDGIKCMTDTARVAILLFANYLDAATTIAESNGGGGGTPDNGWGRDEDEDDLKWLRRCIQQAHAMCKPVVKMKRR